MSLQSDIDDWLLGYKTRAVKGKSSASLSFGNRQSKHPLKPGCGLANLRAAALKQPEVMVKIPRRKSANSTGLKGVCRHIDYISRNGEVEVETHDGERLQGKKDIHAMTRHWQKLGIADTSKHREALNIVLSMPAHTPPAAVKNAARKFAQEQFDGHQYVFALHTDRDRPNEPAHPHVHLCVLMRDEYGHRINPRKNDLFEWRVRFAEKLREEGVACAATRRQHRGITRKGENFVLRSMRQRGFVGSAHKKQAESLIEALAKNERPKYLFLKEAMQTRGIIVGEYGRIAKELYKLGHKTEAKIVSKLAAEVSGTGFNTQAQVIFDQSVHGLSKKQSHNANNISEVER
ncbi:relaxase/mobilization nuclease domain-containing protein [Snodgrassella sp. CFCC 13594]|uniref:relaxase/mobilization nuclease domain-containing protein n=1 Tax=Snodgrassella sp. CFCC 13594 TaxID=1775559 RepID=UPI00083203EC|nr:relaxase/mobilization nuclease domain-containing protein [Snodgrassella sp. CFCC 13594]